MCVYACLCMCLCVCVCLCSFPTGVFPNLLLKPRLYSHLTMVQLFCPLFTKT